MAQLVTLLCFLGIVFCYANALALHQLAEHIKTQSKPHIAPVRYVGSPVEVKVDFQPINVASVDVEHGAIEVEAIVMQSWDAGITWLPADFDGLEYITLPKEFFWLPTLNPFQSATEMRDLAPPVITVFSNGTAVWFATYKARFWCDVSAIATGASCSITMAIWGYSRDRVAFHSIDHDNMQFARFFTGSKYEIIASDVSLTDFPVDGRVYQFATFQMTIKEKNRHSAHCPYNAVFQFHGGRH